MKLKLLVYLFFTFFSIIAKSQLIDSTTESWAKGGTKTTVIRDTSYPNFGNTIFTFRVTTISYKNADGIILEEDEEKVDKLTEYKETTTFINDGKGRLLSLKSLITDALKNIIASYEVRWEYSKDTSRKKVYEKKTGTYSDVVNLLKDQENNSKHSKTPGESKELEKSKDSSKPEKPKVDITKDITPLNYPENRPERSEPLPANKVSLGPALMHFGDKSFHYTSLGVTGEITHLLNPHIGLTADVGIYWHKTSGNDGYQSYSQIYDQYSYTAGVSYMPCSHQSDDPFLLYAHALAGISTYKVKDETSGYGSSSSKSNSFTFNLGVGEEYQFGNSFGIGIEAAYMPTFFYKNTQNNYRLGAKFIYRFPVTKETKKNPSVTNPPITIVKETQTEKIPKTTVDKFPSDSVPLLLNVVAKDFDYDPPLYKPDGKEIKATDKILHKTNTKLCKDGLDVFDYRNTGSTDVIATLIIKKNCSCPINVLIQKVEKLSKKDNGEKQSGDTKEKKPAAGGEVKGDEKLTRIHDYFITDVLGNDVFSFKISKGSQVRITVKCNGPGNNCDFSRYFSVTKEKEVIAKKEKDIPKLLLWNLQQPSTTQIPMFQKGKNECISKDTVFYFIHNLDVKDVMRVYYRAVSDCDCYFEAYGAIDITSPEIIEDQKPKEGDVLGADDKNKNISKKIAPPAHNTPKLSFAPEENVLIIKPGKVLGHGYILGRCPVQQPRPGPCKGYIEITGITYTNK